jgi:glycosyltransferase involved in cell wall biosynthesis
VTSVPTSSARGLPSVTALICTYNYAGYLGEAIDSVLAQEYPHDLLEILVVDDGSTDRTPEVLDAYVAEHGDRIRVLSQPNAGVAAATARGIAEARGELIAVLDADDAWLPRKTRRQVEMLRTRPETGLVHADMELVDRAGRRIAPSYWRQYDVAPVRGLALASLLRGNAASASTLMFRRSLAERILPFPDAAWSHDWWIAVAAATAGPIDFVAEALARHRNHDGAMTKDFVRVLRRDVELQRSMLRTVDLETVSPREMRAAWDALWESAKLAQGWTGRPLAEDFPVAAPERAEWLQRMVSAGAAASRGETHAAAREYLAALACDPYSAGALDGLDAAAGALAVASGPVGPLLAAGVDGLAREARTVLAAGERDRAAHLLRRALEAAPGHAGLLCELADVEFDRARWADAAALWRHAAGAAGLSPRTEARLEIAARRALAAAPAPPAVDPEIARGRLLVCADALAPMSDGSEAFAAEIAAALQDAGWTVEIATRAHAARTELTHRGMTIHEIVRSPMDELRALVDQRGYEAVLAFSSPMGWPVVGALRLPVRGPRVVTLTSATAEVAAELRASAASLASMRMLLDRASGVASVTQTGPDARLLADLGVEAAHIPVVPEAVPPGALPAAAEGDGPLLVAIGDLTPEHGYGPLLRALSHHDGDWRLVIAGAPVAAHGDVQIELERMASADRRVKLLGEVDPAGVAALVARAAAVLSPASADPWAPAVLEAMRHGVPWIATPDSVVAGELAGGIVLPIEDFPSGLDVILGDADAATRLGDAGRRHRESVMDRGVLAARLDALVRGLPVPAVATVPPAAWLASDEVRAAAYDRAAAGSPTYRPNPTMEVPA